jgi:elongation factor Ts
MAAVSAAMVKELRERTGLGMLDCKKALKQAEGNIDKAIEDLRKSSGMKAAKKSGRIAAEGVVAVRVAADGASAVMVEVNSETDFAARDEGFLAFVNQVADKALVDGSGEFEALMTPELESARQALVQKIGENIGVRRVARESVVGGVVGTYVHGNSRIGVLVGLSGGDAGLAKDVAMHIAALSPQYVSPESVPAEVIAKERDIYIAQAKDSGKPAEIIEKMVGGRVRKFLQEISLSEQPFVKDPDVRIGQLVSKAGAALGAFIRYEVGEGIDKQELDFAEEVAAQLK